MSNTATVLVLTGADDPTADAVVAELRQRRATVYRVDTADFPARRRFTARFDARRWTAVLTADETADRPSCIPLSDVSAVYYRRPSRFSFPVEMSDGDRAYADAEARIGVGGVLAASACRWVSHPHTMARAEWKPLQLQVAADAGLTVPVTLVSNDPGAARDFVSTAPGPVVVKPLSSTVLCEDDGPRITYTTVVDTEEMVGPEFDRSFSVTTHMLQRWVPKQREARVIVCGRSVLATAIEAHSEQARVDWRRDYARLTYAPVTVPDTTAAGLHACLDSFDLSFGVFDFVITPEGEWVMLELNPNGQWLWLHHRAGLPIPAALADLLTNGDHR